MSLEEADFGHSLKLNLVTLKWWRNAFEFAGAAGHTRQLSFAFPVQAKPKENPPRACFLLLLLLFLLASVLLVLYGRNWVYVTLEPARVGSTDAVGCAR